MEGFINNAVFSDLKKLQLLLKKKGINADLKTIKKVRDSQEWHQLTQEKKKPKKFNTIYVPFPRDLYYMDVMVYNRFEMNNYKYILNVIDTNSRYASSRALTNMVLATTPQLRRDGKKAKKDVFGKEIKIKYTLLDAIVEIFEEMGYPKELRCDNQFISKEFVDLMKKHDVVVIYSDPGDVVKNSLIERFNRLWLGYCRK